MSENRIRFSPSILKRLGEELNPSVDQGILELVKNSYDADATTCTVTIGPSSARGGVAVTVTDDGVGMTEHDVVNGWLILGSSTKTTQEKTPLGRTPAGNKGLGRLAALRLGEVATMSTKRRESFDRIEVKLDWNRFDKASTVDEVVVPVRHLLDESDDRGTSISISRVRKALGRAEVKKLARALILLSDPFDQGERAFTPVLKAPAFADLEELVTSQYFSDAQYHLVARLEGGQATAQVLDWRGLPIYEGTHDQVRDTAAKDSYSAPDMQFDLWVFVLTSDSFVNRQTSISEVRAWLESFGGVHVYSNGIRVAPYGNPGTDWLDMNLSRARSPEERPSTNTSIGRMAVKDPTGTLLQKTDRSGFIEDEAFEEMRRFGADALNWMARRRLETAEARRQKARQQVKSEASGSKDSVQEKIGKIPGEAGRELQSAFNKYDSAREKEAESLRREVQLYRTLSTAGITAATVAHESDGGPLKVIGQSVGAIERRLKKNTNVDFLTDYADPVESIKRASGSLSVLSSATLRLVEQSKRRVGRVDLNRVVAEVLKTFAPFLAGRDVRLDFSEPELKQYLLGTEAAVESILTNLLNNSLAAFERGGSTPRVIEVSTTYADGIWRLSVSDNGPGIKDIDIRQIWLPGQSRRPGGTGLGLTIVRDATADLNGDARVLAVGHLGGATFTIDLPVLEDLD